MSQEPAYIAQTFEPEHVVDAITARAWFESQIEIAREKGCTWPRMSTSQGSQRGLLFEAWLTRPEEQGEQRWSLQAAGDEDVDFFG